jgi:imidazole glycerol phosphate synthase subunit HisF
VAKAYTPGLLVTRHIKHRCVRRLPIAGEVKVAVGDTVIADDIVAETSLPGDVNPINLSNLMSLPPKDVIGCMLKQEGDPVAKDEPIALSKGMFGMFKTTVNSRFEGTVETVSPVTGQVIIRGAPLPVQVRAYMGGEVVAVREHEGCEIEADVAYMQGIFGVGGETNGRIVVVCDSHDQQVTDELIGADMKDAVIIGGGRMTIEAIRKAQSVGAAALISGGLDDQDLKSLLGYDLGVAITGREELGITVIVSEGFGDIAMAERTFAMLKDHAGQEASVNGATQIRAGVMRPELIIPLAQVPADAHNRDSESGELAIGRTLRIIRDPWFGMIGEVSALPAEPHELGSGSKARVLEVKFPSGETAIVPRANVELIWE